MVKHLLIILIIVFGLWSLVPGPLFAASQANPQKLIKQAHQKEEAGDYEGAQKLYEEILKNSPDDETALLGLAQVRYWQGHYKEALDGYLKLLAQNPNHFEAIMGISKTYLAMGNQKRAEEYLNKAQKLKPENKEIQALEPQLEKKTKIRIFGGYTTENLNYTSNNTQTESQEISVTKEQTYGFGLKTTYITKFGRNGFDTNLFGHYYFKEKTRVDLGVSFAPKITILPQQAYTVGLAHTLWKITPEVSYTFQDYSEANLHFIRPALFFEPINPLRIGGGYEYHRLTFGGANQNFHSGFGKIEVSPLDWLSLNAFYKKLDRGFEGGRSPTPYINYKANVGGGGIGLDLYGGYAVHFDAFSERRSNGDHIASYTLSIGYIF